MIYKLNDPKVIQAIDLIVRDTDKKYDECLVEKFQDFIHYRIKNGADKIEIDDVVRRIQQYMEHEAFIMMNQTRAIKILSSALDGNFDRASLDKLWNILDTIVVNNDLSAMTVILKLLNTIISNDLIDIEPSLWLLNQRFSPPIKLSSKTISDCTETAASISNITDLIERITTSCINYHTKKQAVDLLHSLLHNIYFRFETHAELEKHILLVKEATIRIITNAPYVFDGIILKILNHVDNSKPLHERLRHDLRYSFWSKVQQEVKRKRFDSEYLSCIKSLALLTNDRNIEEPIFLQDFENISGIAIYLSHLKEWFNPCLFLTYFVYPLSTRCRDVELDMIESPKKLEDCFSPLFQSSKAHEYVRENLNDCSLGTCVICLNRIINAKNWHHVEKSSDNLAVLNLTSKVLLLYIRTNYSLMKHYKNVLICFQVLHSLRSIYSENYKDNLLDMLNHQETSCSEMINKFILTSQNKLVLLELIKLHRCCLELLPKPTLHMLGEVRSPFRGIVQKASCETDPDVLSEYADIFISVDYPYDKLDEYAKLLWQHMNPIAQSNDHCDLIIKVAKLLIKLDLEADKRSLDKCNIKRYQDIPKLIGEILINYESIVNVVEVMIEALASPFGNSIENHQGTVDALSAPKNYIEQLDSPNLSSEVREILDNYLTVGLCKAIKGESSEEYRRMSLQLIVSLVEGMLLNWDDEELLLNRLLQSTILETLYEVATVSAYDNTMQEISSRAVKIVKLHVINKLERSGEIIRQKVSKESSTSVERLVEFYLKDADIVDNERMKFKTTNELLNKPHLSSFVDDILNFELLSDGILDCY